jgi:hypothetical protein
VNHLYRKSQGFTTPLLLAIAVLCSFPAHAQRPEMRRPQDQQNAPPETTKKPKRSARAIGVVEFLPGGGTRLVPVSLWYEGKYYDASTYDANPSPLAVAPGTVYQALSNGELAGTFVVNLPKLSNAGWIGDGRWTAYRAMDAQLAAEAAKQPKATAKQNKAIFTGGPDQGPPVLRRPGSEPSSEPSSTPAKTPDQTQAPASPQAQPPASVASQPSAGASTTTSDSSSGRPTLRRPTDEPVTSPTPTVQPTSSQPQSVEDNDPDRPVFRRPASASGSNTESAAKQQVKTPSTDANDPDRPLLTRGDQPSAPQPKPSVPVAGTSAPAGKSHAKDSSSRSLAAISDAGKYETRPLVYATTPEMQQHLAESLRELALADIRAFAAKHVTGPQLPKNAAITDYDLRFFDLDFSNSPTLVLTAKLPMPTAGSRPFVYYATYVAHLDVNGDPAKVFSAVTDTTHLDVFPRLELIDAVDADANGRGDLLFRQYSDAGINYGLYRVFPYNMEKVFEGGGAL